MPYADVSIDRMMNTVELFHCTITDAIKYGLPMKKVTKPLSEPNSGTVNIDQSIFNGSLQSNGDITGPLFYDVDEPDIAACSYVLDALVICKEYGVVFEEDIESRLRSVCDDDYNVFSDGKILWNSYSRYWNEVLNLAQDIILENDRK